MKTKLIAMTAALMVAGAIVPAMAGRPSPIRGNPPAPSCEALSFNAQQTAAGGWTEYCSGFTEPLNSGYNALDYTGKNGGEAVSCANTKGCLITASAMVEVENTGLWAICAEVLTTAWNQMNPNCPYQGNAAPNGGWVSGSSQQSLVVPMGKYTVHTELYSTNGTDMNARLGNFETRIGITNLQ